MTPVIRMTKKNENNNFSKKKYSILKISFPKNMIEERIIKAILMLIMVLPRMKLKGIAETRKFKKLTL
tara:strand:+ start:257 stop:460 length:204 start_codon:yes stop_codon:yes gene_type:complete